MTFVVENSVLESARSHAHLEYPRESCGVVVIRSGKQKYYPCRNLIKGNEHFMMHPEDLACAEDLGAVVAYVHSHPSTGLEPSEADLQGMEVSKVPWVIVSASTDSYTLSFPSGHKPPLYGRHFAHGIFDCYSFVRDAYLKFKGFQLPDYARIPEWWEAGQNLIVENFEAAGFVEVECNQLQIWDGLLMRVGSGVVNHVGILVDDNMLGHHMTGRLSSKDVYSDFYRSRTLKVVRHKDLL